MTVATKADRVEFCTLVEAWTDFHESTSVGVIRSASDCSRTVKLLDRLLDEVGDDESNQLAELVDLLGTLIAQYEDSNFAFADVSGREVLELLIHEHALRQSDLVQELGSQGVVSEILSGKREINSRQAKALALRFGISPAAFI